MWFRPSRLKLSEIRFVRTDLHQDAAEDPFVSFKNLRKTLKFVESDHF